MKKKYKINNFINNKIIKLIDSNSNVFLGIFKLKDCILKSRSKNLDLVELNFKKGFSICKILNYNKFIYFKSKKKINSNKEKINFNKKIKEIKFRLFISDNDYKNKFKFINKFLSKNLKIKITIIIKGREILKKNIIKNTVDKIILETSKFGVLINSPNYSNKTIFLYFNPKNNEK